MYPSSILLLHIYSSAEDDKKSDEMTRCQADHESSASCIRIRYRIPREKGRRSTAGVYGGANAARNPERELKNAGEASSAGIAAQIRANISVPAMSQSRTPPKPPHYLNHHSPRGSTLPQPSLTP
ncbi:MAG: hypothetical protein L0922_07040, partial [Candidatus Mariimomonas ferrooxydans]